MMLLQIVIKIIICLILTIVIEYIPIVFFLNIPKKYFIAVNVLTNVFANVILISYDILNLKSIGVINRWQLFVGLEVIICIIEIYLYYIYYKKKLINEDSRNCSDESQELKCEKQNDIIVIKKFDKTKFVKIAGITIFANLLSVTIGGVILDKLL